MISPRRAFDIRLREDSDPEDDGTLASPGGSSSRHQRHQRRASHVNSAAAASTQSVLPPLPPNRDVPSGGHNVSHELGGMEAGALAGDTNSVPSAPAALGATGSLWPRRRSGHVRDASRFDVPLATADESQLGDPALGRRAQLQNEAPIRELAKQLSRLDIQKPKRGSAPQHRAADSSGGLSTIGTWLSSHTRPNSRPVSSGGASSGGATAATAATTAAVAATNADPSGMTLPVLAPPTLAETGGPGANGSGLAAAADAPGVGHGTVVGPPETPPPLRGVNRRDSLVNHEQGQFAQEEIEQDLMIGEIKSVSMNEEIALVRKAAFLILLSFVGAILLRHFAGKLDKGVDVMLVVSFVAVMLLSFPVLRFTARLFAYVITTRASGLLYRGNRYYFVVALHYDIAITVWSILSVVVWKELFHEWVYSDERRESRLVHDYGDKVLQCHLALRVGFLVKNFLVLLVATSYLWRPYLRRVQSSILAQYILLLLTDYCTKGWCNSDDQKFALEMGKQGIDGKDNISLYAVSKAMGFIPRNKLGHSFFRELGGSDTLDSSKDATLLGNFLFQQLLLRSKPPPTPSPLSSRRVGLSLARAGGGSNTSDPGPPRSLSHRFTVSPGRRTTRRFMVQKRHSESSAPTTQKFFDGRSTVAPSSSAPEGDPSKQDITRHRSSSSGDDDDTAGGGGGSGPVGFDKVAVKVASSINKLMSLGSNATSSSSTYGGGSSSSSRGSLAPGSRRGSREDGTGGGKAEQHGEKMPPLVEDGQQDSNLEGHEESKESGAGDGKATPKTVTGSEDGNSPAATPEAGASGQDPGQRRGEQALAGGDGLDGSSSDSSAEEEEEALEAEKFCPALHPDLLMVALKIFDLDDSGTVSREEMVLGVVGTFQDHRSLALTLQDSEHVAQKLGLIIMAVIIFILVFVWLSIWGADVLQLSVTFASFLIAFSFMIGTAASNLMTSVLFIFVTRLYDVGDRVHLYNDASTSGSPLDLTVVKVDLMTTVFKRWDEQVFYMPNHLLASKTIVNIQRTAHQWHQFWIHISANTPSHKIKSLQHSLQAFAKSKDKPEGLYSRIGFALTAIEDSTRLTIRITFRQRNNWQNMEKKWACQSMCTWAIKNSCDSYGIKYTMPEVPVQVKQKIL